MTKKLYKSQKNRMIFGVCGGLADYFNMDVTLVRIIVVVLALIPWFRGFGVIAYIICGIIIPKQEIGAEASDDDVEKMKSANMDDEKSDYKKSEESKAHSDKDFNDYFSK